MRYINKNDFFDDFFERRSYLITEYSSGKITKKEFLQYNYDYFVSVNVKPFIKIDSYEKGMYNYQYYNGLAKYYRMLAKEVKNTKKHSKYYNYYLNLSNKYYAEKDKSILDILKIQNFKNSQCYYVNCKSNRLNNLLYEIILNDKKEAIFHSKAIWLKDILFAKNIFEEVTKTSLIEDYINERY